jgi:alkanesulfonate monooxygenase SsuD/methylene tetrahydromethanopterin reductase-like flavin-dependent oxidoreductase (luciferase family)
VLGTSVLNATFRYNPAVIAQAFATMACLYPDRVVLGLGTGEELNETAVTGQGGPTSRPGSPERARRHGPCGSSGPRTA